MFWSHILDNLSELVGNSHYKNNHDKVLTVDYDIMYILLLKVREEMSKSGDLNIYLELDLNFLLTRLKLNKTGHSLKNGCYFGVLYCSTETLLHHVSILELCSKLNLCLRNCLYYIHQHSTA